MGILMPLYTTGIVIFFVYTVMRIMFKKNDESSDSDDRSNPRRLHQQLRNQTIPHEYLQPQRPQQPQAVPAKKSPIKPKVIPEEIIAKPVKETESKVKEQVQKESEVVKTPVPDARDEEIMILKQRLEETEKAMQMVVSHMATLTSQMQPAPKEEHEPKVESKENVPKQDDSENEDSETSENDEEVEEDSDNDAPTKDEKIETLSSVPIAQES